MSFGLFDFAQQNPDIQAPQQEAQAIRDTAQTYRDRQERQEKLDQLKAGILQQFEQGDAPQLILYTAIRAIGTATADNEWAETAKGYLDRIYSDLMQESFIDDNAATAAKRLEEQRAEYVDKARRRMKYLQRETNTIYGYVQTVLEHLELLENVPENLDRDGHKIEK